MFKNIFPDKINRLVYRKLEAPMAHESIQKVAKKRPTTLREEARELGKAIKAYTKLMERNVNAMKSKNKVKIDLNNPKSFNDLPIEIYNLAILLRNAKGHLESGDSSRVNLNHVRALMYGASGFYSSCVREKRGGVFKREAHIADISRAKKGGGKRASTTPTRATKRVKEVKKMMASQNSPLTTKEVRKLSKGFKEVRRFTQMDKEDIAWAKKNFKKENGEKMQTRDTSSIADQNGVYAVLIRDHNRFRFFKKS